MYHRIPTLLLLGHLHQDKGQPWQTPCRNSSTAVVTHSASGVSLGTGWGTAASVTCGDSAPVPTAMGREWSLVCQPGEDMEVPELVFWWLQEPWGPLLLSAVMQSWWAEVGTGICILHPLGQLPPSPAPGACGIKFGVVWYLKLCTAKPCVCAWACGHADSTRKCWQSCCLLLNAPLLRPL